MAELNVRCEYEVSGLSPKSRCGSEVNDSEVSGLRGQIPLRLRGEWPEPKTPLRIRGEWPELGVIRVNGLSPNFRCDSEVNGMGSTFLCHPR